MSRSLVPLRAVLSPLLLLLLLAAALLPAHAWGAPPAEARRASLEAAGSAARAALVPGPKSLPLRDQATLALPEHFGFVPRKEAADLMRAMGNRVGEDFIGLVVPLGESASGWFMTVNYDASGYIKDDDARHWDADKLLKSLKDGTEAANEEREKVGVPAIEVTRWIETPAYAEGAHELVWAAEARRKDGKGSDPVVNYNTYVLGREGYLSLDLITRASAVEDDRAAARQLLAAAQFNSGKRYQDFNSSTDKVAAYGLAALVAGVAAKKLGLIALFAATIVKFAKLIGIALVGAVVAVKRWLGLRNSKQA
jgi:uncharacterized membrane-anchored protein